MALIALSHHLLSKGGAAILALGGPITPICADKRPALYT